MERKTTAITKKHSAKKASPKPRTRPKQTTFDFGAALHQLAGGAKMTRTGWNAKGMFIVWIPGSKVKLTAGSPYAKLFPKRKTMDIGGHFDMYTAQRTMQPGWLASQADMTANDWVIVK